MTEETTNVVVEEIEDRTAAPTQENSTTADLIFNLADAAESVSVDDYGYQYSYIRLVQPNSAPAPYFAIHYRENNMDAPWYTCNGLLSKFSIAKTENLVHAVAANLNVEVTNPNVYHYGPTVKVEFNIPGFDLEIEDETDIDRVIFKLMTNIDVTADFSTAANLKFTIVNGFSGGHALSMKYGVNRTFSIPDSPHEMSINNLFLLANESFRLIHDGRLDLSAQDVEDVRGRVANRITLFKSLPIRIATLESIKNVAPKKFYERLFGLWAEIPEQFTNLYYFTFVLSRMLQETNNLNHDTKIHGWMNSHLPDLVAAANDTTG